MKKTEHWKDWWLNDYEFPGWDRCLRCLCHGRDECPDLEYLYSLQEEDYWWNYELTEEERFEYEMQWAAEHQSKIILFIEESDWVDEPF